MYMHVTVTEEAMSLKREQVYGRVWREEMEWRKGVIIYNSLK